ncbi:YcnI family protein [Pseudarthrobacter sp. P1]|uniref:YcnI family copper-binding membrane protein n=1 Tax=Pseudarthrobacter sp. P1 TaxID=3418418 RepID=UPI003CF6C513
MTRTTLHRALKTTLALGATGSLMALGLGAASAHVEADPTSTAANSYSLVSFSIGHGCSGSPTTSVAITLPTELNDATPTVNANWTISKTTQKLDAPVTQANGSTITERTSQIIYTAKTPLDAHQRDVLTLSLKVPDAAGKTLYFPTLQSCETGETNWADIAAAGQDPETLKAPAPSLAVTAAAADADAHGAAHADGGAEAAGAEPAASAGASQAPGWIGLGAGLLGLAMGGVALVRTRKTAK